jgi:UDP-glucose 4-epimerase
VKVVVTGGAGFIGANLCRQLLLTDGVVEVVALDDLSTGRAANLEGTAAALVVGDLVDPAVLDEVLPGADAVVHLGALPSVPRSLEDPLASHHANATGTLQVLEAVRRHGVGQIVVASSSSVYGNNPALPKTEDLVPMPASPYAVSKLATEAYALSHAACFGFGAVAFRFFNVFGPLQAAGHAYAAVVPAFVSAALAGEPVVVHGDGGQTRDFTYVATVCEVLSAVVRDRLVSDRPVNLAFGGRASLLEVLDVLEGILGHPLERIHTAPRVGDVRDSQADQTTLRALVARADPVIEPVGLEAGLRHTVDWFRAGPSG